jgi:hypothetical protein
MDIVERLHDREVEAGYPKGQLYGEAANTITRLRRALASETDECAKVAATYAGYGARADVCMAIATAIRSRKDKGE